MTGENTFTMDELQGMIDKAVAAKLPSPTADLETSMGSTMDNWMNKDIAGIPIVQGVVGGTVAEIISALVAKSSALAGQNKMLVDLAAAFGLGWLAKKKNMEWARYGAMFMVFSAFQTQIQTLVVKISGLSKGTSGFAQDSSAGMGLAQSDHQTPLEVEQWLRAGSR
jgi:hypothetical protein